MPSRAAAVRPRSWAGRRSVASGWWWSWSLRRASGDPQVGGGQEFGVGRLRGRPPRDSRRPSCRPRPSPRGPSATSRITLPARSSERPARPATPTVRARGWLVGDEHRRRRASAGARLSICCSPPDSRPAGWPRRSASTGKRSVAAVRRRMRSSTSGSLDPSTGEDAPGLRHEQHARPRPGTAVSAVTSVPSSSTRPRSARQPNRHPQGRPGGAEERRPATPMLTDVPCSTSTGRTRDDVVEQRRLSASGRPPP
jgi:hypothetical protein